MWALFAIGSAIFLSVRDISIKKSSDEMSCLTSSLALLTVTLPISIMILAVAPGVALSPYLFGVLITVSLLDTIAIVLYAMALKVGDISKTSAMLCFVPVFQTLICLVIFGDKPSPIGALGIVLATCFILYGNNFSLVKLVREPSSMLMLSVSLLWGGSSILHKVGATEIGAIGWTAHVCSVMFLLLFVVTLVKRERGLTLKGLTAYLLPSLSHFATLLAFYEASALGHVAYVSSLRRLSVFFSILAGRFIFQEKIDQKSIITTIGLVSSAVLIALWG